jgi:D-beta-D-heptose 7-phosphate kinase/D-beta-D-heptose 1-phosphate adenosyltransferase
MSLDQVRSARVLCIGDVMLEHAVTGSLTGGGKEPVLRVEREARRVGGAGTVLRHLATLGVAAAFVSVVGNDAAGREIERLLAAASDAETHLLVQPGRTTTVKTRFFDRERPLLRADRDSAAPLGPYIREDLLRLARELVTSRNVVVISDHAGGVLTEGVALEIIRAAQEAGARIVVDPEGGDPIRYRGADLLVASRRELGAATGLPVGSRAALRLAAETLINRCAFGGVLVGADPAAVAVVAASLGAGMTPQQAVRLAGGGATLVAAGAA